jgi:hypothetical protein
MGSPADGVDAPQKIAQKLLQGWAMLNEYCPKGCNVPLVRSRHGERCCVVCEAEPGGGKQKTAQTSPAIVNPHSGAAADLDATASLSPQITPTPGESPVAQPHSFPAVKDDASPLHTPTRAPGPGPQSHGAGGGALPAMAQPALNYSAPPRNAGRSGQSTSSDFMPLTTTLLTRIEAYRTELENTDPSSDLEKQHKLIVMIKDSATVLATLKDLK